MYKSLKIPVEIEVGGRYSHIGSNGASRPADILPSSTAMGLNTEQALDIALTDPTSTSAIKENSDTVPLVAAKIRQNKKISEFRSMMTLAAGAGTPIQKIPLVLETTGAYGSEMQN